MPKQFFTLKGDYAGRKARRLAAGGRITLYRMLDDGEPYWLVQVRNFNEAVDRPRLRELTGSLFGNGARRFLDLNEARRHYELLLSHPGYAAEAAHAQKMRAQNLERFKAFRESGKAPPFPRAHENPPDDEST